MSELTHSQNLSTAERAVSAGLGGFILARYGGRSILGTALAVGLIQRAATGHCQVYSALGIDSKDPTTPYLLPTPPVHVSQAILIRATPEQIYPFFSRDLEKLVALSPEVLELQRMGTGLSRWTVQTPIGQHTFISEIVERKENERLAWACTESRYPHSGQITLEPGDRGTTLRVSIDYRVPGGNLTAQIGRLTGHEPHEALQRALYNLQSLLETGEVPQAKPSKPANGVVGTEMAR